MNFFICIKNYEDFRERNKPVPSKEQIEERIVILGRTASFFGLSQGDIHALEHMVLLAKK